MVSSIQRSFRDLSNDEVADIEKASLLVRFGWQGNFGWDEILRSERVLIVSEAGAGKTFECQMQQKLLWDAGEPAFFLDLATLGQSSVRNMLTTQEEARFEVWMSSQYEIATFFLDSIDELNLTLVKFEQALKVFSKAIAGQLGRVRIVITTRPVPVDRALIERYLPITQDSEIKPTAAAFADSVMGKNKPKTSDEAKPKALRNVGLMPLSPGQIRAFAELQGVGDAAALIDDIHRRDAMEFAERPQDLNELCADWREHQRIRTHLEQVGTNVKSKLKPRFNHRERVHVSLERAIEGASRLALAAILTRKLTLRYSADTDSIKASEAALDVSKILCDWTSEEQATLLERPLFGFASYGRVRFHHRSVVEYLAALRLEAFLKRGVPAKAIKRILFVETAQGTLAVRPLMRPVAAWLSVWHSGIFDEIIIREPAVVFVHGDPQSLTPDQRIRALDAYIRLYGKGGWRGLHTPHMQVRRFASTELAETIIRHWNDGIENYEVRELLLEIIGEGKIVFCADIAYAAALDGAKLLRERSIAVKTLLKLRDPRLDSFAASIEIGPSNWPDPVARYVSIDLLPEFLPVSSLKKIFRRVQENPKSVGDYQYRLPQKIEATTFLSGYLHQLRQSLSDLLVEELAWEQNQHPHLQTGRPELVAALAATCCKQYQEGVHTPEWIAASLLSIRLAKGSLAKETLKPLRQAIFNLSSHEREEAFFAEHIFIMRLYQPTNLGAHAYELFTHGGWQLDSKKDANWIRKRLSDPDEPVEHREMMLWIEMFLLNQSEQNYVLFTESLKQFVSDVPSLLAIIEKRLEPQPATEEWLLQQEQMEIENRQHQTEQSRAHASWVNFWHEIVKAPSAAFASERANHTAWNLWQAMNRSGTESRASGWNRQYIETQFGKDTADRLRAAMKLFWRNDKPTLPSERPNNEKATYLVHWQFGLACIAAEAEDPNWAKAISINEAELACRYALVQLNGFPSWLDDIGTTHPAAIDHILGQEFSHSMNDLTNAPQQSSFLQDLGYASPTVASLFVPQVWSWLIGTLAKEQNGDLNRLKPDIRQAIIILLKNGSREDRDKLGLMANQALALGRSVPLADVWLPVLMAVNPVSGVEMLEFGLKEIAASKNGAGAHWFAQLFGSYNSGFGPNLRGPEFTPGLLLRLVRLSYQHVRVQDDADHEGAYSPDMRDDAESGRNAVLSALLATSGVEGWVAKLEMANDPLFVHFKDRAIALAREMSAGEADNAPITEAEFAELDKGGESPPSTNEAMFALLRDRLDDIDDALLQDTSPRELWATVKEERLLRRALARELQYIANHIYTVDQEAATADEKETDIRLRSTNPKRQAVIELKVGEKRRSAVELRTALKEQLLQKYMAAEECRAGCLVISISSEKKRWKHADTGKTIGFEELIAMLNQEAQRLSNELGGSAKLMAKGLDLRPRLKAEKRK